MAENNKLLIQINGVKYSITTAEEPGYVQDMGRQMDKSVRQLMGASPNMSLNEALVLIALSYLDAYKKEEQTADNLRNQIAEYLEDAAKARLEAGEAKREVARLERKLGNKDGKST